MSTESSEWEELFSKDKNKKYWKNKATGKATWKDPTTTATTATNDVPVTASEAVTNNDEWEELFSKEKNKKYWKNKATGKSTWKDPTNSNTAVEAPAASSATAGNDDEWEELFHKGKGKKYWKNKRTGESTWKEPVKNTVLAPAGTIPPPPPPPPAVTIAVEDDWEELFHKGKGKKYWKNKRTGESTWKEPPKPTVPTTTGSTQAKSSAKSMAVATTAVVAQARRTVAWLKSETNVHRCLLELRESIRELEIFTLHVDSGDEAVKSNTPERVHLLKLEEIQSLVCNQILGQLIITMQPFRPPPPPPPPVSDSTSIDVTPSVAVAVTASTIQYVIHFVDSRSASLWLQYIVDCVKAGAHIPTITITDYSASSIFTVTPEMNTLCGTYELANCSEAQLKAEALWVLGSDVPPLAAVEPVMRRSSQQDLLIVDKDALPTCGLIVVMIQHHQVQANSESSDVNHRASEESKGDSGRVHLEKPHTTTGTTHNTWTSCWVKLDNERRSISFHDHGPGSRPTHTADCTHATIHVPDLATHVAGQLELHILGLQTAVRAMSLSIKFQSFEELFRWGRALVPLCVSFSYFQNSVPMTIPTVDKSSGLKSTSPSRTSTIKSLSAYSSDIATALLAIASERSMTMSSIRTLKISGEHLRTARFVQVNERVVVLVKGCNEEMTEGSVLMSINGLSAVSVPPPTVLKFVADFPSTMTAELVMWRFPRSEFHVDVVNIDCGTASQSNVTNGTMSTNAVNNFQTTLSGVSGNHTAVEKLHSMFGMKHSEFHPHSVAGGHSAQANKLEQVLMRKRLSILHNPPTSGANPLETVDVATIKEQQATQEAEAAATAAASVANQKVVSGYKLSEYSRARAEDVPWSRSRLMIASGCITVLRHDQLSATVSGEDSSSVIGRLQITSCVAKLSLSPNAPLDSPLNLELNDGRTHIIIRCPSQKILLRLVQSVMIAIKLFIARNSELTQLYDYSQQRLKRRENKGMTSPSPLESELHTGDDGVNNSLNQENGTFPADNVHISHPLLGLLVGPDDVRIAEPDESLLRAAENLESTLSELQLPTVFPTAALIEKHVSELMKMNLNVHRVMSEQLTAQYVANHPLPQSAESASNSSYQNNNEGKTQSHTVREEHNDLNASHSNNESGGNDGQTNNSADDDQQKPEPSDDNMQHFQAAVGRRTSTKTPTPNDSLLGRRASTNMSMESLLGPNTIQSTVPFSTVPFSQKSSTAPLSYHPGTILNSEDRRSIATVLRHLREHSHDLVSLAQRAGSSQNAPSLERLAAFTVHRLCHYTSTSQATLEAIIVKSAEMTSGGVKLSNNHSESQYNGGGGGGSVGSTNSSVRDNRSESSSHRPYSISSQNGDSKRSVNVVAVEDSSPSSASSSTSFLSLLLKEIARRADVIAFVLYLCEDINIDSLTTDSGVVDLCARVVEPLCRRLESSVTNGIVPSSLQSVLRALTKSYDCGVTSQQFLSNSIVPVVANFILHKNRRNDELRLRSLSAEHIQTMVERINDLLHSCFEQDVLIDKKLQLCLSDTAALSRSKWLISKCIDTCSVNQSSSSITQSAVSKLAAVEPMSGKTASMHNVLCLRPSELIFLLECLDLSNIMSTALTATSREVADALAHLQTSHLLSRLTAAAYHHSTQTSSKSSHFSGSQFSLDREITYILQLDRLGVYSSLELSTDDSQSSIDDQALLQPLVVEDQEDLNSSHQLIDTEQGASELASLQWLISAARSALKAIYEQQELSKSTSTIRELKELNENLRLKGRVIATTLADVRRLETCKDLCANFKAQQQLLLEQYRNRRRRVEGNGNATLNSSSGLQQLLQSSGSTAAEDNSICTLTEEEYTAALSKMVMTQLRLERDLSQHSIDNLTALTTDRLSSLSLKDSSVLSHSELGRRKSKLVTLAENTSRHELKAFNSPFKNHTNSSHSNSRTNVGNSGNKHTAMAGGAVQVGGPNPLWVIMQNVFNKSPKK